MLKSYSNFEGSLQKTTLAPNYFLFGPDSFLLDNARSAVISALKRIHGESVSAETMDLEQTSIDDMLNMLRNMSLFVRHKVVQVRGVMRLREVQCRKLSEYLSNPSPTATIVFYAGELDRDQRKKKIFEILSTYTNVNEFAAPDRRTITEWLRRMGLREGFTVDSEALDYLLETQGNELGRIIQEIEKARLYASGQSIITLSMVELISGFPGDHQLFEFLDAVFSKNKQQALRFVEEIFFTGKESFLAFWWFGLRLRQLLQLQELSGRSSLEGIARQVGIYPRSVVETMLSRSKKFSRHSLEKALYMLGTVDDRIKKSGIGSRYIMERLVYELTR